MPRLLDDQVDEPPPLRTTFADDAGFAGVVRCGWNRHNPDEVVMSCEARRTSSGYTPDGIRTRAATLKGWRPRPLVDGGVSTRIASYPGNSSASATAATGASSPRRCAG